MTRPDMVVFDLDDTLYEYEPCDAAARAAVFRLADTELGVKSPAFERAFDESRRAVKVRLGRTASSHSRLLYCHDALERIGLGSVPAMALALEQEYWREFMLTMQLRPGAIDFLHTLRYHGVQVSLVTDLTAQIQFRKLIYLGLDTLFDHIVCSEETVGEKDGGGPFDLLWERLGGSAPSTVWFVGDQPFDAPTTRLRESGAIRDGRGFVRAGATGPDQSGWRTFAELDRRFRKALG